MSDDRFGRYRDDPVSFVEEVLGVHLYSRQREIVEAVRDHERVAVKSGNATGKTTSAACVMLAWLAGGPGSVVVSTSATEAQLRRVLWRETRRRFKQARGFFHGAVVTETEIRLRDDWHAVGFSTDTPEAMQGIHAQRVLVVVDEASGVAEDIFDAVESLLAGGDARVLLIGNPLRTSGTFFDCWHSKRDEWHALTISAHDTPAFTGEEVPRVLQRNLVSAKWVERLERRNPGGNEYLVKVLGEFPAQADDTVVARVDLEQAQAQTVEPGLPLIVGVDVARFGGDKTVLAVREGHRIRVARVSAGRDLMETSGAVIDLARQLHETNGRKPCIVVDDVGLGGGVTDRLRELNEYRVVAFNGGGKASTRDAVNKRSELWLRAGEVMPLLDLDPVDEELAADLLAPTFSFASDGARMVEAKANTRKRLRRSPDRADAVLLTLVVDPPVAPGRARRGATILNPARAHRRIGDRRVRRGTPTTVAHDRAAALHVRPDPVEETLAAHGVTVARDDPDGSRYQIGGPR
jgi:phage terminase large subunit